MSILEKIVTLLSTDEKHNIVHAFKGGFLNLYYTIEKIELQRSQ